MVKQHLKRIAMPRTWQVKRKGITFITRPNPGAHSMDEGMPLTVLLKKILGLTTTKEVKAVLNSKDVLVNGNHVVDHRHITGLFDVISIPKLGKHYRIVLNRNAKIADYEITEKEAKIKPFKLLGKTIISGGKVQLNLTAGKNLLVEKDSYATGDSLLLELPENNIKEHLQFGKGAFVFLQAGKHSGVAGTLEEIDEDEIVISTTDGKKVQTKKKYAFVVGKQKSAITLNE